eukprot:gnl/TRDRNA2_/TRDRNA2_165143_c1_seq1.p1 gnl/TRDRNA2_/TRDRNA2_165143_c1~~gnl/TRDRNA2_/TRDRNA2_165143_c1_seq1.p1  ORF type:complete len:308 (+),score=54.01 gnl/TRDRNA2_/TRDRNA2_165143_c1_seq1:55-924(+)
MPRGTLRSLPMVPPRRPTAVLPSWAPLGLALRRHLDSSRSQASALEPLLLWSDLRPRMPEVLPGEVFFRAASEMPPLERKALELCRRLGGRALDVGAGAGSHVLALAKLGVEAEGMDICSEAVEVMRERGVRAKQCSLWDLEALERFDSLLMLMNSVGVVGSFKGLHGFLRRLHSTTSPGCCVVLDTSPPEWPAVHAAARRRSQPLPSSSFVDGKWAVLQCQLTLGSLQGETFPMLFAEAEAVASAAAATSWRAEIVCKDTASGSRNALLQLTKAERDIISATNMSGTR